MVTGNAVPAVSVFADDFSDTDIVLEEETEENAADNVETDIFTEEAQEAEEIDAGEADTDSVVGDGDAAEDLFTDDTSSAEESTFSDGKEEQTAEFQSLGENQVELPDYIFGKTWNAQYDVLYHEAGKEYLFKGEKVEFPDENHVTLAGATLDIRNKETTVTTTIGEDGKVSVALSGLSAPVDQIPGLWNRYFGGALKAIYKTDVPGLEQVETSSDNLGSAMELGVLAAGVYHLTGGVIYEKANQWSPGNDFGEGNVTERNFGYLPDITITVQDTGEDEADEYLGVNAGSEVPDSFQNDLWTQYDFKELKVGDTAKLIPRRVEEAITDAINNDVQLPHFNYEIIKGDSVTLDETDNSKVVVTAQKAGNTVVKITYDALDHKNGKHFDAVDPVNTAYVVYSVDGNENISITDNIINKEADRKDDADVVFRSYDTVYFTEGETTPFTLKASAEGAEKLSVKCNGITVAENGSEGTYTLPLENRSNIIEITAKAADGTTRSKFHVLDARKIKVNVENETHEGQILEAGDTAKISFTGITMPVYKLATIYNPQFNSAWGESTYVHYTYGSTVYKGHCSQWDLAIKNSFEVTFPEAGEYTFEDGAIHCSWWGSDLGTDKTQDNPGEPNLNAPTTEDEFSFMPDFNVSVDEDTRTHVESVTLDKTELQLEIDDTAQLTATVSPEDATYKDVTWSSSNTRVATVDENGQITAVAEGEAEIKAVAEGKEAVCKVTVTPEKEITASVTSEEKIYDGDKVTVTLANIKVPKEVKNEKNIWDQYTGYETDIPRVESVKGTSEDLGTISFTVPEGTPSGEYTLKNGYYFANYGGAKVQGVFIVGNTEKKFYEDKMPEIKLTIVNREEEKKQEELRKLRTDAIEKLESSVDYNDYRTDEQEMIKEIVDSAEAQINALETEEEMQAVVAKAQKRIASVKTAAQYDEAELKVIKADAKKELDNYKNPANYRTAQKKELSAIVTKAKLDISEADSEKEIKNIVADAKAKLNKLATDKALSAKESKQVVRAIVTTTNTTASIRWNKITSAAGYRIYGAKCDGKPLTKLLATVNGNTLNWRHNRLTKGTSYKYYVEAYKVVNGKKVTITKSDVMHVVTTGGRYGNSKGVSVKNAQVSVAAGKTYIVKATVANTSKVVTKHVSTVRYKSSDNAIATVSKNGTIKGVKKGTCYVYCYASNGAYKTVKVTVK